MTNVGLPRRSEQAIERTQVERQTLETKPFERDVKVVEAYTEAAVADVYMQELRYRALRDAETSELTQRALAQKERYEIESKARALDKAYNILGYGSTGAQANDPPVGGGVRNAIQNGVLVFWRLFSLQESKSKPNYQVNEPPELKTSYRPDESMEDSALAAGGTGPNAPLNLAPASMPDPLNNADLKTKFETSFCQMYANISAQAVEEAEASPAALNCTGKTGLE